jgi:hypothetical protein
MQPETTVDKILNPKTNRYVSVNSRLGKQLLKKTDEIEVFINDNFINKVIDTDMIIDDVPIELIEDKVIIDSSVSDIEKIIEDNKDEILDIRKRIRDRKEYMKGYYDTNKDKIKQRAKDNYISKKSIRVV